MNATGAGRATYVRATAAVAAANRRTMEFAPVVCIAPLVLS